MYDNYKGRLKESFFSFLIFTIMNSLLNGLAPDDFYHELQSFNEKNLLSSFAIKMIGD